MAWVVARNGLGSRVYLSGRYDLGPVWSRRLKRAIVYHTLEDAREAAVWAGGVPYRLDDNNIPKRGFYNED